MRNTGYKVETRRTARCAEGLFCTAVPITHSACTFTSSEDELSKPCRGSHMRRFSRSECVLVSDSVVSHTHAHTICIVDVLDELRCI